MGAMKLHLLSSRAPSIITREDRIYAAIVALTELIRDEIIQAIDMLSVDETKANVFMALPVPIRRIYGLILFD